MKEAKIKFKFVTPALLGGADQLKAEMRIPSLRGALRWWYRAFDLPADPVFGSVNGDNATSSSVILRDLSPENLPYKVEDAQSLTGNQSDYFLWPLRINKRGAIVPGTACTIQIQTRPGRPGLDEKVLKSFLLLGCLGTRSRRAYGSVWPVEVSIDGAMWRIPRTLDEFRQELQKAVSSRAYGVVIQIAEMQKDARSAVARCAEFLRAFRCGSERSGTVSHWGKNDHDVITGTVSSVHRPALGLPLMQRYSSGKTLETTVSGLDRLASPVHFKVAPLDGGFVPIATVFTDTPTVGKKAHIAEKTGRHWDCEITSDLLETIADPDCKEHRECWKDSSILGEFYG